MDEGRSLSWNTNVPNAIASINMSSELRQVVSGCAWWCVAQLDWCDWWTLVLLVRPPNTADVVRPPMPGCPLVADVCPPTVDVCPLAAVEIGAAFEVRLPSTVEFWPPIELDICPVSTVGVVLPAPTPGVV